MKLLALALAALLMSGCSGGSASGSDSEMPTADADDISSPNMDGNVTLAPPAATAPTLMASDCEQIHGVFPNPSAAFGTPPEGFDFVVGTAGAGTVDVLVFVTYCQTGNVTVDGMTTSLGVPTEFWAGIPMTIPAGQAADTADVEIFPLTVVLNEPDALAVYEAAGVDAESGDVIQEGTGQVPGAAHIRQYLAETSIGEFRLEVVAQDGNTEWPEQSVRIWGFTDGAVTGAVRIDTGIGTSIGLGSASLAFTGDPTAGPGPFAQGVAHFVTGIPLTAVAQNVTA